MKPEMSTAVMIERVRELATDSSGSQDCVLLTQVANRIELLLAAESGVSREMACIRHALDIPPDQFVQSGVVKELVRLNAKIQDLGAQLAELGKQNESQKNAFKTILEHCPVNHPDIDKDGDAVSRELMARGVEQAASGFHEKAFVAFEGSNEPGLYIRAQLQLLAQQLRDGDA
ncbi:hypothetical protein [Pectobacterium versatile]|uniref:hypothetical protein n=1 Tax=Pectobacterium versatile TaxID=2488639 RepID=UPI001B35C51C|nr:hypothetical protein [Pectobacterium versatile]MBQ4778114.1 hypothetical protein [Pectobacterium versatile]